MIKFDIECSTEFILAKAYRQVHAELREELKKWGITPCQLIVMAFLWENDGNFQAELSQKSTIDRTTTGGIIDNLEKMGLVTRQSSPKDRRAYQVMLTEKGKNLEDELCQAIFRVQQRIAARITPEGYVRLQELLGKLLN
jgi:DNA-binding MarR family transcriptional regulator